MIQYDNERLKKSIIEIITVHSAIKNVDLALAVMAHLNPQCFGSEIYFNALEELIRDGEIMEIEYTLPNMDYRVKSIYMPKGTSISIKK